MATTDQYTATINADGSAVVHCVFYPPNSNIGEGRNEYMLEPTDPTWTTDTAIAYVQALNLGDNWRGAVTAAGY
jgi:hypothetical protein